MNPTRDLLSAPAAASAAETPPAGGGTRLETHWTRCLYSDGSGAETQPTATTLAQARHRRAVPDPRPAPSLRATVKALSAFIAIYVAAWVLGQGFAFVEETTATLLGDLRNFSPAGAPVASVGDASSLPSSAAGNERAGGSPARQADLAAVPD